MIQQDNMSEMLPIVDEQGNILEAATRGECHGGSMKLHPVVHLHLFNSAGDIYLQKRPEWKDIQPGKWDTAVGGHIDLGESVGIAIRRETREELGIDLDTAGTLMTLLEDEGGHYVFESSRERELVYPHKLIYDGPVTPSPETDGGRFWTMQEVHDAIGKDVLTPNFEQEFQRLFGE